MTASSAPHPPALAAALDEGRTGAYDIPGVIGGQEARTGRTAPVVTPHVHTILLGHAHHAGAAEVEQAIDAARGAARDWGRLDAAERAKPFLKAAELLES